MTREASCYADYLTVNLTKGESSEVEDRAFRAPITSTP